MSGVANITNPIALCAYVVAAVFGLLAKRWNSRSKKPHDRHLFYLAASVAVLALAGGLFLAWWQSPRPQPPPQPAPVVQSSSGDQSPNIQSSGNGSVTVEYGDKPKPKQQPEKKQ
jgi:hypothetical protein